MSYRPVLVNGKRVASPEYRSWQMMKNRCLNPKATDYKYYGGRGIKITEQWLSFDAFIRDMGPRPSKLHTLDRINSDGPSTKSNCRWVTRRTQSVNRLYCRLKPRTRDTIYNRWKAGDRQVDIAKDYGVSQGAISALIRKIECRL